MIERVDLVDGGGLAIQAFVVAIVEQATMDHDVNAPQRPYGGYALCNMFARKWRRIHHRLATTVYNQTRDTLRARGKP